MYLELLVENILRSWKKPQVDLKDVKLSKENDLQGYSEAGFRYYY
ncbi:MAG: hypothetical protein Q8P25_03945 [Candidatus Curtissbacteria bacterium]|nr:hypothetical protein [Candidatus Curtissbacteria bacterium]